MVDCQYLAYILDLRPTPPTPFCYHPPPPPSKRWQSVVMVISPADRITCLPSCVGKGWWSDAQKGQTWALESLVTVQRGWLCLGLTDHHHFHALSSTSSSLGNSPTCFNLRRESKLFCILQFAMFCHDFATIPANEKSSVLKPVQNKLSFLLYRYT